MTAHTCRPISKNSKTVSNCFSAMRLIRSIRRSVSKAVLLSLVRALVLSRVDYGNATLAGLPARQLCRLQSVFHAAARIVFSARKFDHVTPLLQELHWLRVPERITFKLASFAFRWRTCLRRRTNSADFYSDTSLFSFFLLRVLEVFKVFGLNATLICSVIITLILILIIISQICDC